MCASPRPDIVARRPADVLATVPYLLGFHPRESLVLIALGEPRHRVVCAIRVDLPSQRAAQVVARQLLVALRNSAATSVLVLAYSDTDLPARFVVTDVARSLDAAGLDVLAVWRADGSRWWCCSEPDRGCCPAAGTPYDHSSPCAASAVLHGMVALPDRGALEQQVAPRPEPQRAAVARLTRALQAELRDRLEASRDPVDFMAEGQQEVEQLVRGFVAQPRALTDEEVARLTAWLAHVQVRDAAWCLQDRADAERHLDLWQQVTRRAPPGHVAAPAALLAFAAWLAGHGALAQCALDRVFDDNPRYSLGRLVAEALANGLPPTSWEPMSLPDLQAATRGARSR